MCGSTFKFFLKGSSFMGVWITGVQEEAPRSWERSGLLREFAAGGFIVRVRKGYMLMKKKWIFITFYFFYFTLKIYNKCIISRRMTGVSDGRVGRNPKQNDVAFFSKHNSKKWNWHLRKTDQLFIQSSDRMISFCSRICLNSLNSASLRQRRSVPNRRSLVSFNQSCSRRRSFGHLIE